MAAQHGSTGQRLRRSRAGAFCQKWRDNEKSLAGPAAAAEPFSVETVEKVPFQKLIFGKWEGNIKKRLIFGAPHNILVIFEPVVGDFCEDFSSKEFFDSLVRQPLIWRMLQFAYGYHRFTSRIG